MDAGYPVVVDGEADGGVELAVEVDPQRWTAVESYGSVDEARDLTAEANLRETLRRTERLFAASTVGG